MTRHNSKLAAAVARDTLSRMRDRLQAVLVCRTAGGWRRFPWRDLGQARFRAERSLNYLCKAHGMQPAFAPHHSSARYCGFMRLNPQHFNLATPRDYPGRRDHIRQEFVFQLLSLPHIFNPPVTRICFCPVVAFIILVSICLHL